MRRFFGKKAESRRLRKSQSVPDEGRNKLSVASAATPSGSGAVETCSTINPTPQHHLYATTANGDVHSTAASLTPSRTFDGATNRAYNHHYCGASSSSAVAAADRAATAISLRSAADDETRRYDDAELDRSIMQTITDVKYVNRRPKFTAVVDANFQRQCLEAHNIVRQKYGAPALIWSQELADLAKTWSLKLADRGRILYPELPGINENIHLVTDEPANHLTTGPELVALWCDEARQFDFSRPKWNLKCKNFTQMIWRSTVEMGVARFWNTAKNCLAIVAFYRPGGNSNGPGEFALNLPSADEVPSDAFRATQLDALLQAINRLASTDGGFRSTASQPATPAHGVVRTKIIK